MKALSITNLQKTYANGLVALKGINLAVEEGDFFALLGPNGAGKSTTIGIISSLVNKTAGQVQVFDADIDKDWAKAKSYIGVVPQEFNFSIFEIVQNVVVNQAGYFGVPRKEAIESANYYLNEVGLWDRRFDITQRLSGGMKRRLMIARALVHNPRLLILDEPTAGVDIEIRRSMWAFLQKINAQGKTIILTTHYLEEAESLCKNIAIIDKGLINTNTTMKALLSQLDSQSFIFDLTEPLQTLPVLNGYNIKQVDDRTLEIETYSNTSLNSLFLELTAKGLEVKSMRTKSNRLEELFLNLTRDKKETIL